MDTENVNVQVWPVWIDWDRKIISFQEVKGFEKREYPTHEEMFRFAYNRTMEGFAVQ